MLNVLNGLGESLPLEQAIPYLKDPRVERVARILAKQNNHDPDGKDPGRVCLDQCIGDNNAWCIDVLPDDDIFVYWWMRYIEQAHEILEVI